MIKQTLVIKASGLRFLVKSANLWGVKCFKALILLGLLSLNWDSSLFAKSVQNNAMRNRFNLIDSNLKKLSKDWGLFYFYQEACPACSMSAPLLRDFSKHYGFEIRAISRNGHRYGIFAHELKDNGIIDTLEIGEYPTLYLVNKGTKQFVKLSVGSFNVAMLFSLFEEFFKSLRWVE